MAVTGERFLFSLATHTLLSVYYFVRSLPLFFWDYVCCVFSDIILPLFSACCNLHACLHVLLPRFHMDFAVLIIISEPLYSRKQDETEPADPGVRRSVDNALDTSLAHSQFLFKLWKFRGGFFSEMF